MSKSTEKFLNTYREYETLIRNKGLDPRTIEETSEPPLTQARLRMCRQFRNYLSHQNDSAFLEISSEMSKFLQQQVDQLKLEGDPLKKHIKTVNSGTVSENDKVSVAMEKMVKLKTSSIVVRKESGYALVSIHEVAKALLKSKTTRIKTLKTSKEFTFGAPLDDVSALPSGIILCTKDGTEDGRLLGVRYE